MIQKLILALTLAFAAPAQATVLSCQNLPNLVDRYLDSHVSMRKLDAALTKRVVDRYLSRLDPSRSLLLESEADALAKRIEAVTDAVHKRCDGLYAIHQERVKWHAEMEAYVRKAMADGALRIDRTIELEVDSDKRPRPKTLAERNELRRKLIHFQLANYVAAGEKLADARAKLIHRYELVTKRVGEMDRADQLSVFLDAMASALDPHSSYFSADALEDFRIAMSLSLEGIGAVLQSRDGYTTINEIVTGGAADKQGELKTKDKIIAVAQGRDGDAVDVVDMALRDVVRRIRGKKGTEVKLTVLRQGAKTQTLNIVIVRDKINLAKRAAKLRWEDVERGGKKLRLAILDLPSFYGGRGAGARQCTMDVRRLLSEVKVGGADGLLLDLSRNSGGLLQAAVEISGYFIRTGNVVGVDGPTSPTQKMEDDDPSVLFAGPMVVLTSRASASASEIVTGALKDYTRAVVVGDDHTFGKGTVQVVHNLPPGLGALKVTTALFFRPGGDSTQSRGVASDIVLPSPYNHDEFGEKHQTYALPSRAIPEFRSDSVNGDTGWKPVTKATVGRLASASAKRVAASKEFVEILEKRKKAMARDGVARIAEILDDKSKKDADEDDKKDDEEKLTPRAKEALQILADLVRRR